MNYILEWQRPELLYWLLPLLCAAVWYRARYYQPVQYRFTLVQSFIADALYTQHPYQKIFFIARCATLFGLALLIAMPRLIDIDSKLPVEGIDIMLVLDVSGSMQHKDDERDGRTRIQVAKEEAIRFIEKRYNDAIGLVLFAQDALSRVPLTMDKQLLKDVIGDIEIGFINANGTLLFTGVVTAANRLKYSKAKSKIMILLTDGEPTDGDMSQQITLDIVNKLGIKIYTIGIGSDEVRYISHPLGLIPIPGVNRQLLASIAQQTGGKSFLAKNPHDMRTIYDTINQLERSEQETPLYGSWYDIAFSVIWIMIMILCLELIFSTFVWFSI